MQLREKATPVSGRVALRPHGPQWIVTTVLSGVAAGRLGHWRPENAPLYKKRGDVIVVRTGLAVGNPEEAGPGSASIFKKPTGE